MTKHAFLALVGMMLALWAFTRACNTAPATSQPGSPSATWPPAWPAPMGRAWLPVTGVTVRDGRTVGVWGAWSWVDAAIAHADKPTAAPTPTRTGTPPETRPPRATRTQRPTGTPTTGNMLPPPTCGAGTVQPGPGTPWPLCYPHGPSYTPTPTPTATRASDTPPASATWEPTPTPRVKATPAAWVPAPETWHYYYPMMLVRARVKR